LLFIHSDEKLLTSTYSYTCTISIRRHRLYVSQAPVLQLVCCYCCAHQLSVATAA